ncbi:sodium:solute symporter family protein [Orbus sturtevantii]|uniref:sodium:solute symporter family protein n=1 Tax=Orbus sturtevantii TaxID=3074109 RepID=UPI00370D6BDB
MDNIGLYLGIVITLGIVCLIGIVAMRKVTNSEDFSIGGRKSTAVVVAGAILGSIVGGGGTVGTAQAAFSKGLVGWWQTLGLGMGCLVLGVFFANHLYKTKVETVPQVLMKTYGPKIGPITSIFGSIAIFFSIISQLKSFTPLLQSMFPDTISLQAAAVIGVILVLCLVMFGGLMGASMVGLFKMLMIYISMVVCGVLAFAKIGGFSGMFDKLPASYFNLFADGSSNLASGVSLCLGVLVTQIYIQAVLSAIDAKAARNGALISCALTLPMGLFGVAIGMYMKVAHPELQAAQALPQFFLTYMPSFIAGIFIATLMITTLGSMAGLSLGVATMMTRDLYKRLRATASDKENLYVLRGVIVVICLLAGYFTVSKAAVYIQEFVFLSFALRTCVFLIPMAFAFFYKGRLTAAAGLASVLAGPIVNIIWNVLKGDSGFILGIDPIFAGLMAGLIAFILANEIVKKNSPMT